MAPDQLPTGQERERLLQSCKALIFKWASVHLRGYLDKLDEQLFRMADKAGSDRDQNRYLQARQELRTQRRTLEKALFDHLKHAFQHYLELHDTATDLSRADSELRLVDNDQLEQSIAIAAMIRRAGADCSEALYALNQRLSVLAGGHKIVDRGNPVAPAVFAEGLQQILAGFTLDTPSKLVVYKLFDSQVLSRLDKLYHLLNHDLKNKGVLTHLRYQIHKSENTTLPEELQPLADVESAARQSDLMQLVQQLQALTPAPAAPAGVAVTVPALLAGLRPLQQAGAREIAATHSQQAAATLDYRALPQRIETQTRNAERVDADVIEIVGLLFEYVLNDEQLPDSVKALLSYLHTPFLKVALLDRQFFNHPQHPARQLLNSLVAAGERWVEPEGKHKSDVFQQIRLVVQRILDEFDDDLRLLSQLNFEFNQYLVQHARRVRLAEQRAQQAARGEDRLKEIRGQVERYLRRRTEGAELPEAVRTLLFEPWANYLAFNLLRFGADSEQWRQAAEVVDTLLHYLQPQPPLDDLARARLWQLRDRLEESLQHGLHTVGYDADNGQRLIEALHATHEAALAQPRRTALFPAAPAADIEQIAAPPEPDDPLLMELGALEFGTWFLFAANRPRREQYQVKLAWSNRRTQHYMFVNRLGQQVAVKSGAELAAALRTGELRILQPPALKPFFERALERVAEQLRRRRPGDAPR